MRRFRDNPDGAENQAAMRDNARYVGGLKLAVCQWQDGCNQPIAFDIQCNGKTFMRVCGKHAIEATQQGYQIR
jgi:hypothetical protein